MARSRKKRSPLVTLTMWSMVAALVGWGVWHAELFRRTLIADASATQVVVAASEHASATQAEPASGTMPGGAVETVASATGEEDWANAMTPGMEEAAAEPPIVLEENVEALLKQGTSLLDEGRMVEGRAALNAALAMIPEGERLRQLREQLTALNGAVFLGTAVLPDDPSARFVEVQEGDTFLKLGQRYAVPAALLEAINPSANPKNLKTGSGIKIVHGPFHVRMFKSARRIDLYARDVYVRSFEAEVMPGDYLPSGVYRVASSAKIQVAKRQWIGIEGISESTSDVACGWLYGQAGPRRSSKAEIRASGLKMRDADIATLYNVLVETRSLLRVEP